MGKTGLKKVHGGDMVVFQDPRHTVEIRWARPLAMALFDFKATVSKSSWTTYEVALRDFFGFIGELGVRSPELVVTTHLTSYLEHLKGQGKADRTVLCYAGAVSSFYDFLKRPRDTMGNAIIKSNPWDSVRDALPKVQPYVKESPLPELGPEDYGRILGTCGSGSLLDLRDRAILSLILWTIRRRQEIVRLRVEDFGMDQGVRHVRFLTKGRRHMSIELDPGIWGMVEAYWRVSGRELSPRSHAFVATTMAGNNLLRARNLRQRTEEGPLAPSSLDRMLKSRAARAGVDERKVHVHVHGLRHLGARVLRAMGVDLKEIKERLGHSRLDTTDIYLGAMERVSSEGLEEFAKLALGRSG